MDEEKSVPALRLIIPLPIALYCSNGLLFELYEGGQPFRRHRIFWERVKPQRSTPPLLLPRMFPHVPSAIDPRSTEPVGPTIRASACPNSQKEVRP